MGNGDSSPRDDPPPPPPAPPVSPGSTATAECPRCHAMLRASPNTVNMCPLCQQQFSLQPVSASASELPAPSTVRRVEADRLVLQTRDSGVSMNVQCTCPGCRTVLTASAQGLRQSEGSIVCGNCSTPFHVRYNANLGINQQISNEELMQLYQLLSSVSGGPGASAAPRLSSSQLSILPTRVVTQKAEDCDEDDERRVCMVCLSEKEIGETVRTLPCMHTFHKDCVDEWLQQNATCPVCKLDILGGIRDSQADHDEGRGSAPSSPVSQEQNTTSAAVQ